MPSEWLILQLIYISFFLSWTSKQGTTCILFILISLNEVNEWQVFRPCSCVTFIQSQLSSKWVKMSRGWQEIFALVHNKNVIWSGVIYLQSSVTTPQNIFFYAFFHINIVEWNVHNWWCVFRPEDECSSSLFNRGEFGVCLNLSR